MGYLTSRHSFFGALLLLSCSSFSQSSIDLFNVQYLYSPSNNQLDYTNYSFKTNIPSKIGKDFLINTLSFNYANLSYHQPYTFNTQELENFHEIKHSLTYSHPLDKGWRVSGKFSSLISSNLQGSLSFDDIFWNGALIFTRKRKAENKENSLTLGIAYVTLGKPRILPVVRYTSTVNDRISYVLGVPKTYIRYNFNPKKSISLGVGIDGNYANLSGNNKPIIDGLTAQRVSFRTYTSELGYRHNLSDTWYINTIIGYSLYNEYLLVTKNEKDLYDFDLKNRFVFSFKVAYDLMALIRKKVNP